MKNKESETSENVVSERPRHVSLTHFMRRNWRPNAIRDIVVKCNVNPNVGVLPPELRARIPQDTIGECTARFHAILHNFIIRHYHTIRNTEEYTIKPMPELADLFGTHCTIEYPGVGHAKWRGALGLVCRISFPLINANYALKMFYANTTVNNSQDMMSMGHGKWFEIPTAFAATYCEPRDNSPIYMASFANRGYMLSRWCWQAANKTDLCRANKNKIFFTDNVEFAPRNYAQRRRLDYGKTYQTMYGAAPYPVRKMCRQILNLVESVQKSDDATARMAVSEFLDAPRGHLARRDCARAVDIVCAEFPELLKRYER